MKPEKIIKLSFLPILIYALLFSASSPVWAQAVKVNPIRVEETVNPGDIIESSIKVTNVTGDAVTLYAYLRDFKAGGETGQPELVPAGSEIYGSGAWINITQDGIDFAAGETKEIPFTVKVPGDTGPGGYYGAVLFGSIPPKNRFPGQEEERGVAIAVSQQTGSLVLLKVMGDIVEKAVIREFSTDKNIYSTPFEINFLTRIFNMGNVHIKPYGVIEITNMMGDKVTTLQMNEGGANVLPDSIRRFENSWQGKLGFGQYKASLVVNFGTFASEGGAGRQTIYTQKTFWIMPWQIIIPSLLTFIFIGVLLLFFVRAYKNKAVEKVLTKAGIGKVRYVQKYEGPSPALHLALIAVLVIGAAILLGALIFFLFFA